MQGNIQTSSLISKWALHRRLYDWVLSLAHHKHSTVALFLLSFAESSVFPIAPDVLQIALSLARLDKVWYYACLSTIASVLGGILGYIIGIGIWELASGFFFEYIFSKETFEQVKNLYQAWDFWAVFVAAFTPIPYKVFTIAAGVFQISFPMFVVASIAGRAGRFFLVAALLRWYGPTIKQFIEKYFNLLSVVLVILLVSGFLLLNYV